MTRKTKIHAKTIRNQEQVMREMSSDGFTYKEIEEGDRKSIANRRKKGINQLKITESLKTYVGQTRNNGASSWLNVFLIKDQQLDLNKELFSDAFCLS